MCLMRPRATKTPQTLILDYGVSIDKTGAIGAGLAPAHLFMKGARKGRPYNTPSFNR